MDCGNLGISVLGVGVGASDNEDEKLAIFIKAITPGGLAETDGRMKVGDQLVSVSGVSLLGVTQDEAADAIRNSGENVTMVIARNPYPEDDQVLSMIQQKVSNDDTVDIVVDVNENLNIDKKTDDIELIGEIKEEDDRNHIENIQKNPEILANEEAPMKSSSLEDKKLHVMSKTTSDKSIINADELFDDEPKEEKKVVDDFAKVDPCVSPLNETKPTPNIVVTNEEGNLGKADCCKYKEKYEELLRQHALTDETLRQLNSSLTLVTQQLRARDETVHMYIEAVNLFLTCKNTDDGNEIFSRMSELRDNLLRAPHVPPAVDVSIQLSDFDQAIVNTNVLNSNLAKDKIRLVNRSRNQRRLGNKHLSATKQRFSFTAPLNMDNILIRNHLRASLPINHQRSASCSNSISDSDAASSCSSVQSVPEFSEGHYPADKKRKSHSLLKKMKRRMSFTNNKCV